MDPIADMLNQIKNAQAVHGEHVVVPFSNTKLRIATALKAAGYLQDVEQRARKARKAEVQMLDLTLKYADGRGVIAGMRMMSHPSRHLYAHAKDLKPVRSGYGTAIVSTPQGIMTSKEARKANVGGEVLFEIW